MTVIDWLLDADPAIRWQVMRDLTTSRRTSSPPSGRGSRPRAGAPGCSRSRRRTACGRAARSRRIGPTRSTSSSSFGASGSIPPASRRGGQSVSSASTSPGGRRLVEPTVGGEPLLRGRGRAVHQRQRRRDRLVLRRGHDTARRPASRRAALRWRLELRGRERRTVSSFGTTINVVEGLLEHERAVGGSASVGEARRRGEEYMLERGLFRRKSTGEVIDPDWLRFSYRGGCRQRQMACCR